MNERIKELLDKASHYAHTKHFAHVKKFKYVTPDQMSAAQDTLQEKFAELIVRECMYVGRLSQINNGLVDSDIKEHFGVE
jgi:hypothetical protein